MTSKQAHSNIIRCYIVHIQDFSLILRYDTFFVHNHFNNYFFMRIRKAHCFRRIHQRAYEHIAFV